jgi:hypothetical protein
MTVAAARRLPGSAAAIWRPTRAHERWRAARAAWVAAGGVWPGGEHQRRSEEAASMPDEPFDGSLI